MRYMDIHVTRFESHVVSFNGSSALHAMDRSSLLRETFLVRHLPRHLPYTYLARGFVGVDLRLSRSSAGLAGCLASASYKNEPITTMQGNETARTRCRRMGTSHSGCVLNLRTFVRTSSNCCDVDGRFPLGALSRNAGAGCTHSRGCRSR